MAAWGLLVHDNRGPNVGAPSLPAQKELADLVVGRHEASVVLALEPRGFQELGAVQVLVVERVLQARR